MNAIMPHGYSRDLQRRRLTAELRQARAAELATATDKEKARIEKEMQRAVERKLAEMFPKTGWWPAAWLR